MTALLIATAIGCVLVAGGLWVFSSFILASFAQLGDRAGIEAMQRINVVIMGSWFLRAFFLTGLSCIALTVLVFTGVLPASRPCSSPPAVPASRRSRYR